MVSLALIAWAAVLWSQQRTLSTIETYLNVDNRIDNLALNSYAAMLKARRHEKDFLLKVREFGFFEAKSRYATLLRVSIADMRQNMGEIRGLTDDPEATRMTRLVEEAAGRYEAGFMRVVDLYGLLGKTGTGLEGRLRIKAHEIESIAKRYSDNLLMSDLLNLRRHEKDFLLRGLNLYLQQFSRGLEKLKADTALAKLPAAEVKRIVRLADEYREPFFEYVKTKAAIDAEMKIYLSAVSSVEPLTDKLRLYANRRVEAARLSVHNLSRAAGWTIVVAGFGALVAGILIAFAISSAIIRSVRTCVDFAGRIAQGDLSTRIEPAGDTEFRSLTSALNEMSDALQAGRLLLEKRAAELSRANETLSSEIAERRRAQEALEYQATHDGLTGLPNRNLLVDRIQQAIIMAHRLQKQVAVYFVDLDNFKFINDSLGNGIGDRVLLAVAERMKGAVRSGDTLARQGGDEFVVVTPDLTDIDDAALIAGKILETVSKPLMIEDHDIALTCSIGISVFPKDGENDQVLIKNADTAMFRAKEQGRNNFQYFTEELNARMLTRMNRERHLRRALEQNEFFLHYQPKVSLVSGRVVGTEALIRWQHPEEGLVGPADFIPLAEETGLIEPIGQWVLKTACRQNKAWQDVGLSRIPVAVNLSVRQMRSEAVAGLVEQALRESGLETQYLEIEITESLLMKDTERIRSILNELKELGVHLTIDDFGTGYSGLGYLKRFPFDKLKIDIAFVREITRDPDSAAIALSVIAMAHALHMQVIAEGVETEGQMNYLRRNGCDEMQGYYFSRPLPAPDLEVLLREERRLIYAPKSETGPERTLLLVDDEASVLARLRRTLASDGYRILTATSAAEGLEMLASNRVGVVVSDHPMPGMDGIEFLNRVKALHPDVVRLILSGDADLKAVMQADNEGAVFKYITKPWEDKLLREIITETFVHYRDQLSVKMCVMGSDHENSEGHA